MYDGGPGVSGLQPLPAPQGPPGGGTGPQPGFLPWPKVSPFENRFEQTWNNRGLWMNEINNEPREYFLDLQAMFARMRQPENSTVGELTVDGVLVPPLNGTNFFPTNAGFAFRHDLSSVGMDVRWGYRDPGIDAGLEVGGFWISDVSEKYSKGDNPTDPQDITLLSDTHGIPVNDGQGGSTIPFDRVFQLYYSQEAFGAHVVLSQSPIYRKSWLKLRTMYGLKYMHIREKFGFYGADSALDYVFGDDGRPDPATVNDLGLDPYSSTLEMRTSTHLVGPQIGLAYETGGKILKISGRSLFSLMANHEKLELNGDDFGDGFSGLINQARDNRFYREEENTHVSPAFTQEFHADMNLIHLLPLINRIRYLENSVVRLSYVYNIVGSVARPASSVVYNGLPLFPEISTSHSSWGFSSMNLGFHSSW
ncbi:MAG: hypothetical protein KDA79_21970 [Planctomycetaceae bacterium]|nr:hypothetical protein [Planctomycetaceae bacterium]